MRKWKGLRGKKEGKFFDFLNVMMGISVIGK